MTDKCWHWIRKIKLAFCLALLEIIVLSSLERTFAQSKIVPDNTLGIESSKVINNSDGRSIENITGGAQRGINLFHSFREFNVGEGRAVYFSNPAGIENIIGRVTGSDRSEILGKLGVLGNANLFLLNPNGIIFGAGASLDINGSFVATSANGIKFGEQGLFSSTSKEVSPLLTIKPSALFFNQIGARSIENSSIASAGVNRVNNPVLGLRVADGQSLLLVGGNVLNAGRLNALGGRVELGSVASVGEIGLSIDGKNLALRFPQEVLRGDISLTNGAVVNVAADGGGAIALSGRNINIKEGSLLNAGIAAGLGTPTTTAGDITLNATQTISLFQSSRAINQVSQNATGNSGNINIQTGTLNLIDGSQLNTRTLGRGNSGNISIDARDSVTLNITDSSMPSSIITSQVTTSALGNSGNINIKAESLKLLQGGSIINSTFGQGNSGNISINVQGAAILDGEGRDFPSGIVSQVIPSAIGNSGDINIKAESLTLTNGGSFSTSTFGRGNGGNIFVDVKGVVRLDGEDSTGFSSGIRSQLAPLAVGNGGNIHIKADSLSLGMFNQLSTSIGGQGNAGNIFVDVNGAVILGGVDKNGFGSGIFSLVRSSAVGDGGDINIKADSLQITQAGTVTARTVGKGDAGNVFVDVKGTVTIDGLDSNGFGTGITNEVESSAMGNGGDINIKADSLTLTRGGNVTTSTFGTGNGGNISVDVSGNVSLDGIETNGFSSRISSEVGSVSAIGNGGNIHLQGTSLTLTRGGFVSTSTFGTGNAGNISVDMSGNISLNGEDSNGFGSGIRSQVQSAAIGNGGDINITAESLNLTQGASLSASSLGQGKGGNIQIEAFKSVNLNDEAEIAVNSQSQGDAGSLGMQTGSLTLEKRSRLLADTVSSEGGNIQLQVQDLLLLRDNSTISTTAGEEGSRGNGGNIDINTKFLVAAPQENNDITANAFAGKGGLIKITTQGIFGIEQRENLTPLSDITAFSQQNPQLDGEILIDIQNADIRKELVALPTNLVDVSRLISQGCSPGRVSINQPQSQFIVTGRGGLPPQPGEALRIPAIAVDQSTIATEKEYQSPDIAATPLLEANGWKFDQQGQIVLTASTNSVASSFGTKHGNCHGS